MATSHRVAYYALLAPALAALLSYAVTVVLVVLVLRFPALAAVQGTCFICMSPVVQAEFLIGLIAALLILIVGLACLSTCLARRDTAWSLAFLALLALVFGFAVLVFSGAGDAITVRVGPDGRNSLLLSTAACVLLIPLLALRYTHHLRLAWRAWHT